MNNTPEYTVGVEDEHVGPADWFDEWLAMEKYLRGRPLAGPVHRERERARGLAPSPTCGTYSSTTASRSPHTI